MAVKLPSGLAWRYVFLACAKWQVDTSVSHPLITSWSTRASSPLTCCQTVTTDTVVTSLVQLITLCEIISYLLCIFCLFVFPSAYIHPLLQLADPSFWKKPFLWKTQMLLRLPLPCQSQTLRFWLSVYFIYVWKLSAQRTVPHDSHTSSTSLFLPVPERSNSVHTLKCLSS